MTKYTPIQTLSKIHRELWWTIRLINSLEVRLERSDAAFLDLCEVEKVLRAAAAEVRKISDREMEKEPNQGYIRPGIDLALKAQIAKAREEVADVLKPRPWLQSHK